MKGEKEYWLLVGREYIAQRLIALYLLSGNGQKQKVKREDFAEFGRTHKIINVKFNGDKYEGVNMLITDIPLYRLNKKNGCYELVETDHTLNLSKIIDKVTPLINDYLYKQDDRNPVVKALSDDTKNPDIITSGKYSETVVTNRSWYVKPFKGEWVKFYDIVETVTNGTRTSLKKNCSIVMRSAIGGISKMEKVPNRVDMPGFYNDEAVVSMIKRSTYNEVLQLKHHISDAKVIESYNESVYNDRDYMLVLWNWGSHELADLNGDYLPVPVHVDYMYDNGKMTEDRYDLQKALEIIKSSNVKIMIPTRYDGIKTNKSELKITEIPYYNVTEDECKMIEFYFVPDRKVYAQGRKLDSFKRTEYMLEHTFTGLHEARIIKKSDD